MTSIAVIGAGSWGTAIAIHLAKKGHHVLLWDRDLEKLRLMQQTRKNATYLSDISLPETITINFAFKECVSDVSNFFIAVPSHGFKDTLEQLAPFLKPNSLITWGSKGLFKGKFLHEVALTCLGAQHRYVAISGPSFAKEVALGLPTAATFASIDQQHADDAARLFHTNTFRPYISSDLPGVEICGVIKNVLAIGVGISDGLGFGANARSALITRGLVEMTQLAQKLGGHEKTIYGLAGVGDLILTATDNQSRNRRFGLALGSGLSMQEAQADINQVVEGMRNADEVFQLAKQHKVHLPICTQVYQVLYQGLHPREAVKNLLEREIKNEL